MLKAMFTVNYLNQKTIYSETMKMGNKYKMSNN